MPLVTTGISGLDAQLGGGIPPGTTLLLISDPGNAIGAFSEQFAGGGLDRKERVLYYQLDRSVRGLPDHVRQFVEDGDPASRSLSVYDAYSTQFGKGVGGPSEDGTVTPLGRRETMSHVVSQIQQVGYNQPYRLVIESLSSLTTPESRRQVLDFVKSTAYLAHEFGGVHLLSLVNGMHDETFETELKHLVGGVMETGIERKGFGLYSYLLVSKLVGVRDPVRLLLFRETEKGLWLESTKRVF